MLATARCCECGVVDLSQNGVKSSLEIFESSLRLVLCLAAD